MIFTVLPRPKRPFLPVFFLVLSAAAGNLVFAQESSSGETRWYRSNSSGMLLEMIPSRAAALRNDYSLSARSAQYREIPEFLLPYYNNSYSTELRILYNDGEINRRQWIFRDETGTTRLTASGGGSRFAARGAGALSSREDSSSGIIEIRNRAGDVTREIQLEDDLSEWDYRYTYRDGILVSAEIWFKAAPPNETEEGAVVITPVSALSYTDNYRYTRSGSLRAIDRTLHEGAAEQQRIAFPRLGPGATPPAEEELISYTSGHLIGNENPEGSAINYNYDSRGRVQSEIWRDENGVVVGELTNTWSGDRLLSVKWKTADEDSLTEYEYDAKGDRVVERNFSHGVLERIVINQDGMEIEDIFINGVLMLRAYWENGQKIREERPGERPR
jgi:YD repeat-containing protein